jgi:nucleoside-diphosphate kinase
MAVERTLSIIKPDAVAKNVIGKIYSRFETNGLKIAASRMIHLSRKDAEGFLRRAQGAPLLQGSGRIHDFRPGDGPGAGRRRRHCQESRPDGRHRSEEGRAPGTIRADFADSIDANAVHGSDAPETAAVEIAYFFPALNVYVALSFS